MVMKKEENGKNKLGRILSMVLALCLWQLAACLIDQKVLLASPIEVGRELFFFWQDAENAITVLNTFYHVVEGFLLALVVGMLLAVGSAKWQAVEVLLWPYVSMVKATPVASFIILCLVWVPTTGLSVLISFLMVFPVVYTNFLSGIRALDRGLTEVGKVFGIHGKYRIFGLILPQMKPYLLAIFEIGVGMAFKSAIAAEVIGTPQHSIGKMLYTAKIYLDTPELLAWTVVLILLSVLLEKESVALLNLFFAYMEKMVLGSEKHSLSPASRMRKEKTKETGKDRLTLQEEKSVSLSKSYEGRTVLDAFVCELPKSGKINCLMAPSGIGKTTVFRMLSGLEHSEIKTEEEALQDLREKLRISYCFQDDRLVEEFSVLANVKLACPDRSLEEMTEVLKQVGITDPLQKAAACSGGMKRRVSLVRAMMAEADLILLDEPFAGLDEDCIHQVISMIQRQQQDRRIMVTVHEEEIARKLGAERTISVEI